MKSSILYAVVVLTVSCSLIVQAQECSCGKLGPGTNPCTCSDVVVKAAKLPKPAYYVSPQDINNAAAARSGAVIEPTTPQRGCACSQTASNPDAYSNGVPIVYSGSSASTAYSNSAAAAYSNSASNAQSNSQTAYSLSENANAQSISESSAYSSSSSPTAYSNSASAAFSNSASNAQSNSQTAYSLGENSNAQSFSASSAYSNSGNSNAQSISASNAYSSSSPTAYSDSSNSNAYSNSASVAYSNSDSNTYIDSSSSSSASTIDISTPVNTDMSSNKPMLESLEIDDESSESSSAIVPSFSPIGDLCYPLPINPRSGQIMEKIKVTPAYPGKIVCNICNPSAPYELCVNMQTGETTSRMLTTSTPVSSASSSFIYGKPISGVSSGSASGTFTTTDFTRNGAVAGPITEAFAESNAGNLKSRAFTESNAGNLKSQAFSESNAGNLKSQAFTESNAGNLKSRAFSVINAGSLKSEAFSGSSSGPFGASNLGTYGNSNSASFSRSSSGLYNMPPIVYAGRGPSGPKPYATMTQVGSSTSDCLDDTDVPEVDYSYPQVPADAVSLTLAYKNLRAPNVIYRQGKQFVPEDKLSFGHRTVPNVVKNEKKIVDIAEEKLVTVDKPVVELKIAPARTVVVGSYDEREEAKLAELEAIERESITQEETADQVSDSLITYKDLGYAPVGATFAKSTSYGGIINGDINDSAEVPCGPLGPPVPDYVPGRVVVQQQAINGRYASSGVANENMEIFSSNPLRSYPQ